MMVRFFQRANKIKNFQPCGLFASRISLFHDVHDEERSYFWLASDCLGTLSPAFVPHSMLSWEFSSENVLRKYLIHSAFKFN